MSAKNKYLDKALNKIREKENILDLIDLDVILTILPKDRESHDWEFTKNEYDLSLLELFALKSEVCQIPSGRHYCLLFDYY